MGKKEIPTNFKTYYKLMLERTSKKLDSIRETKDKFEEDVRKLHEEIENKVEDYKSVYNIDVLSYNEFINNKYDNGKLYKDARGLFLNRKNDYKLVSELYDLYTYADRLKEIKELENQITHCNKLLGLSLAQYNEMLRIYYTEVHKKLILEGCGYSFGERIGWICINRVLVKNTRKKMIDYAATKKREAELKAKGIRIWNKEDAEWCKANGIEYKAEDKRVYKNNEYWYEVPLLDSRLPGSYDLDFTVTDYRHNKLRGKTNDQLIEECNSDVNKICELSIDLKSKLTLCDKVDKILYTKFIRNENQKSINFGKNNSESRQRL